LAGLFGSGQATLASQLGVPELVAFLRVTSVLTRCLSLKRDFLRVSTLGFGVKRLISFFLRASEAFSSRHIPGEVGNRFGATTRKSQADSGRTTQNVKRREQLRTATPEARASFAVQLRITSIVLLKGTY